MCIRELLPIIDSDLFLITPIPYPIFSVLVLLLHQVLLVSLLGVIDSINSYGIISNLI
jgi:hypothetical protein